MTNIIELAKQAGFHITNDPFTGGHWLAQHDAECFERFAKLVRNSALEEAKSLITRLDNAIVNLQPHEAVTAINALREPT